MNDVKTKKTPKHGVDAPHVQLIHHVVYVNSLRGSQPFACRPTYEEAKAFVDAIEPPVASIASIALICAGTVRGDDVRAFTPRVCPICHAR